MYLIWSYVDHREHSEYFSLELDNKFIEWKQSYSLLQLVISTYEL